MRIFTDYCAANLRGGGAGYYWGKNGLSNGGKSSEFGKVDLLISFEVMGDNCFDFELFMCQWDWGYKHVVNVKTSFAFSKYLNKDI